MYAGNAMKASSLAVGEVSRPNRHTARGTLQLIIGRIASFALVYVAAVILARGLGPVEYGVYGIIISVLVWGKQIGRFGLPDAVIKLAPENEERRPLVENTTQTLVMIVFALLFILFWLSADTIVRIFRIPEATGLFRLGIIDIPLSGIYFAHQGILTGRRKFGAVSGGLAAYGIAKLGAVLVALLLGLSIFWALIANLVGTLGGLLFLAFQVSPKTFRPSFVHIRPILHLALPIGLFLLALQSLFNLDLWSLQYIGHGNEAVIGYYVAALNIAKLPNLAFSVVHGVVLPSLSMALAHRDRALVHRYIQGAGRFLWVTLVPSCVLLAIDADALMVLIYSSPYAAGASFLMLQASGHALLGFALVFSNMLIARGNPYLPAGVALSLIPVGLFLNFTLIPHLGAMGASTALLLTGFLAATIIGFLTFQRFGCLMELSTVINVVVATAVMTLAATQMTVTGPWLLLKYFLLVSLYCMVLALLGELTWHDLQPFALWRREQA